MFSYYYYSLFSNYNLLFPREIEDNLEKVEHSTKFAKHGEKIGGFDSEEGMSVVRINKILNEYVSRKQMKFDCEPFVKQYLQFEELERPLLEYSHALSEHYRLSDIVERTLKGERTMLLNGSEDLDLSEADIAEYNKIVLYKRRAYVANFLVLVVFEKYGNKTLKQLGYRKFGNMIYVSSDFILKEREVKDVRVSTAFVGDKILNGNWSVKYLIEKAMRQGTVLFLPSESIYPLDLCQKLHSSVQLNVLPSEFVRSDFFARHAVYMDMRNVCGIELYDAIPGSGKTSKMKALVRSYRDELIIVPTKAEERELKEEGLNVFTMDSLHHRLTHTVNGEILNKLKKKRIYVDECFMLHSGQLKWVLARLHQITNYECIIMFGDRGQVPYYAYVPVKVERSRDFHNVIKDVNEMNITYRCPAKMTGLLSCMYDREVESQNDRVGKFQVKKKNAEEIVQVCKVEGKVGVQVLTFTQAEKEMLLSRKVQAITIAEAQGLTFMRVILVRLNQYERMIYYSKPHIVVALSRTMSEFMYLTVVDDLMSDITLKVEKYSLEYDIVDGMKLGEYVTKIDVEEYELGGEMEVIHPYYRNIKLQNKYSKYSYAKEKYDMQYDLESVNLELKNETSKIIAGMSKMLQLYYYDEEQKYMTRDEFLDQVEEYLMLLRERGMYVNESRFYRQLSKEVRMYEQKSYYELICNDTVGEFKLHSLPKSRINEMDTLTLLKSIYKRNADPAQIRDFMMTLPPEVVVDRFMKTFIDQEKYEYAKEHFKSSVVGYLDEWKKSRTLQQLNKLEHEKENVAGIDFTNYNAFIKTLIKNKMDESQYDMDQAAQVVAGAQAIMIEYFTPMVKRFSEVLKNVLKDNILINDGITCNYMEWFVNYNVSRSSQRIVPVEMDYSKFDKNQDWIDLYYQVVIMKEFGIEEELLEEWIAVHLTTRIKFQMQGLAVETFTQRKSGDAFTFMGNTLFTMIMYAVFYSEVEPVCAIFGGDDSLVLFESTMKGKIEDASEMIAAAFNMEIKYMNTVSNVMFASRFLMFEEDHIYIFPDLLKQFSRYNRVAKSKEHVIAQQISTYILDENLFYIPEDILTRFIYSILDRYKVKKEGSRGILYSTMCTFLMFVVTGKTYLLYNKFEQMRMATKEEWDKINKRLRKKVTSELLDIYSVLNKDEKMFMSNLKEKKYINIRMIESTNVEIDFDLTQTDDVYVKLVNLVVDKMRQYCDQKQISYKGMKSNDVLYKYLRVQYYKQKNGYKSEGKGIFAKLVDICASWYKQVTHYEQSIILTIPQDVFQCILRERVIDEMSMLMEYIYQLTNVKFNVEVKVY